MVKKTALLLAFLALFLGNVFASDFNCSMPPEDATFGIMGECIVGAAFGSWLFFALVMVLIIAFALWQAGAGKSTVLPIGIITAFGFALVFPQIFTPLFNIGLVITGIIIVLMVIKYARQ